MMPNTAIDTLRYAQRLRAAGVESDQAETMAEALGEALTVNLATKSDLDALAAELDGKINALDAKIDRVFSTLDAKIDQVFSTLDAKIDGKIESLRAEVKNDIAILLRWTIATQIAVAGLIIAAVKLL